MELGRLKKNLQKVNINKLIIDILQREDIQKKILELAKERLYTYGTDLSGRKLRTDKAINQKLNKNYSKYTEKKKIEKGQRTKNVTLNDTGQFYSSLEIETIGTGEYQIVGDFETKEIFSNFTEMFFDEKIFEKNVLFLSEKQKKDLIPEIFKICVTAINEILAR